MKIFIYFLKVFFSWIFFVVLCFQIDYGITRFYIFFQIMLLSCQQQCWLLKIWMLLDRISWGFYVNKGNQHIMTISDPFNILKKNQLYWDMIYIRNFNFKVLMSTVSDHYYHHNIGYLYNPPKVFIPFLQVIASPCPGPLEPLI